MSGPVVVAVLSHRDPPLVRRLVDRVLAGGDTVAVVHHDPRGPDLDLPRDQRVLLVPEPQPCDWGRPGLALAVLRCVEHAARQVPDLSWLLLVSGQDYPARPVGEAVAELRASPADAYLRSFRVDADPAGDVHPWQAVCRRRYLHRARLPGTSRSVPALRRPPFQGGRALHVGDMWVNLGARAVEHLLEQRRRRPELERYLLRCPIPDEALLPTLLHADADGLELVHDRKRFIRWTEGDRHPAVLDVEDAPAIRASGAYFARKVDAGRTALLDALDAP